MKKPSKVFLLTSRELRRDKPIILLLHGATDDPSEMMTIADIWARTHNVLLFAYDFHEPLEKIAGDFVAEFAALRERKLSSRASHTGPTIITYSYSATVFRKAVLLAPDISIFADVSLIQLVPTAGGSFLARNMDNPVTKTLVSLVSEASAAENPHGNTAEEIWDGEGNRRFYEAIKPGQMYSILIENDPHSLATIEDETIRRRYRNGIGSNIVVIPTRTGVTHENIPNHPAALEYLIGLQSVLADARRVRVSEARGTGPSAIQSGAVRP